MEKVPWDVVGLAGSVRGMERGEAKTCFSAGRAVYIHYFKDIRQVKTPSDCVMLFSGASVPRTGAASKFNAHSLYSYITQENNVRFPTINKVTL